MNDQDKDRPSAEFLALIFDEFFDGLGSKAKGDAFLRLLEDERSDLIDTLTPLLNEAIDCAYIIGQREGLRTVNRAIDSMARSFGPDGLPLTPETKH